MSIRLEKSGELMLIYGTKDEPDDQENWDTRRSKLGVIAVAVAVVTAALFLGPYVPGHELVSNALKSIVAAIW